MQLRNAILLSVLACAAAGGGCTRRSPAIPEAAIAARLEGLPIELTISQRSTADVPGSRERLRLTIGDITRNQVIVSLADGAEVVLASLSMSPGDSAEFEFDAAKYRLTLQRLTNHLTRQDWATFTVGAADSVGLTEEQKIERLIEHVAGMQDAVFIRNGTEHPAAEAAQHLRRKWQARADEITTAGQFIDEVASRSSLSGEIYQIQLAGGRTIPAGECLRDQLRVIEQESATSAVD